MGRTSIPRTIPWCCSWGLVIVSSVDGMGPVDELVAAGWTAQKVVAVATVIGATIEGIFYFDTRDNEQTTHREHEEREDAQTEQATRPASAHSRRTKTEGRGASRRMSRGSSPTVELSIRVRIELTR